VVAAVIAGTALFWLGRGSITVPQPVFHRVTFRRGTIPYAQFSNDGKTIIYTASWDGKSYELYSTQEDSPESRPLGIRDALLLSISKKGEMALLLTPIIRWAETPGTLARVPVSGGAPREIAEGVLLADWSPDGEQLAIARGTATGQQIEYPIGKKVFETNGNFNSLRVSPKGDLLAFTESPLAGDTRGRMTVVDTEGRKQVESRQWLAIGSVAWRPDGSEVWFSASGGGATGYQLYSMDLKGRLRLVAKFPTWFWLADIASDGRVLLGEIIGSYSLAVHSRGSAGETDLYWHDESTLAALSDDGKQALFGEGGDAASRAPDWLAYLRNVDGSPAVQLGLGFPTALSPDGKWAMINPYTVPAQLEAIPMHAGEKHSLTKDNIHHVYGKWMPDGRRIAFVGAEPGHRMRYFVQDSLNVPARPVSGEDIQFDRNADDIAISPDGKTIAALKQDQTLALLLVEGGQARTVPGLAGFSPVAFCRDNSLLIYRSGQVPVRIMRLNLQTGQQSLWKELAPALRDALFAIQPIRVAPDCESYAYSA
jgi:Tol biopolymer transport system component